MKRRKKARTNQDQDNKNMSTSKEQIKIADMSKIIVPQLARKTKPQPQNDQISEITYNSRKAILDANVRDRLILELINELTGMTEEERWSLAGSLEKDQIFKITLAEKSKAHLFKLAKQYHEGHLTITLGIVQTLYFLIQKFEEMLSDEYILRKAQRKQFSE